MLIAAAAYTNRESWENRKLENWERKNKGGLGNDLILKFKMQQECCCLTKTEASCRCGKSATKDNWLWNMLMANTKLRWDTYLWFSRITSWSVLSFSLNKKLKQLLKARQKLTSKCDTWLHLFQMIKSSNYCINWPLKNCLPFLSLFDSFCYQS